jgi:hypothetical protein
MHEAEDQKQEQAGSTDYLWVIRERAWVIILAVVVIVGAALAFSYQSTSQCRASGAQVFAKH